MRVLDDVDQQLARDREQERVDGPVGTVTASAKPPRRTCACASASSAELEAGGREDAGVQVDQRVPGLDGVAVVEALTRDGAPTRALLLSAATESAVVYEIHTRELDVARPVLTEREDAVLRLIAEGKSAPAIGKELDLSTATVKTHLAHRYEKLGVGDRVAAAAEATRRRLLESGPSASRVRTATMGVAVRRSGGTFVTYRTESSMRAGDRSEDRPLDELSPPDRKG